MAKFSTSQEQNKWDALEGSSKTSFDKLLKGTASDTDLEKLSVVAANYSDLAKSIFESGLAAIDERADYLYMQAQEKRNKAKKPELTPDQVENLHKSSKKRAMKELSPELLDTIEEIESSLADVSQDVHDATTVNTSEFNKLNDFLHNFRDSDKKDSEELSAKLSAKLDKAEAKATKKTKAKAKGIGPGLSPNFFTDSTDDFFNSDDLVESVENNSSNHDLLNKFVASFNKKPSFNLDDINDSYIDKFLASYTGTNKNNLTSSLAIDKNEVKNSSSVNSSFNLSSKTDNLFGKAFNASAKTNNDLDLYVKNKSSGPKEKSEANSEDSWFAKLKRMFGFDKPKRGKGNSGFMDTLMTGLGLLLMSPQILSSVGDMVSKFFTWDAIKSTLSTAFDFVKNTGSNIISTVVDKVKSYLGFANNKEANKVDTNAASIKPKNFSSILSNSPVTTAKQIASVPELRIRKKVLQDKLKNASPAEAVNLQSNIDSIDSQISSYSSADTTTTNNNSNNSYANPTSVSSSYAENSNTNNANLSVNGGSVSSSVANTAINSASRSSINDYYNGSTNANYNANNTTSTQIGVMTKAPFTSGIALDNTKPEVNKDYAAYSKQQQQLTNSPVNLGTFNFNAVMSDALSIINFGSLARS